MIDLCVRNVYCYVVLCMLKYFLMIRHCFQKKKVIVLQIIFFLAFFFLLEAISFLENVLHFHSYLIANVKEIVFNLERFLSRKN